MYLQYGAYSLAAVIYAIQWLDTYYTGTPAGLSSNEYKENNTHRPRLSVRSSLPLLTAPSTTHESHIAEEPALALQLTFHL